MLKAGEKYTGLRWGDLFLQVLFVLGLILVVVVFYFTRIGNLKADDKNVNTFGFENLQTAFQFEQEELKIMARIKMLRVDYANDLMLYRSLLAKINASTDYSDLEKREKLKVLNDLYSQEYFDRKEASIEQENLSLENLERLKCAKFCTSEDLLNVQK
jgi:hypothetical protein